MGVRYPSAASNAIVNATIVTTVETVVVTSPPVSPGLDNQALLIMWMVALTIGTTGATLAPRIRRGTTTGGTLINTAVPLTVAAGNVLQVSGSYVDANPGIVAGQQYSITLAVSAATGNSAMSDVFIAVLGL